MKHIKMIPLLVAGSFALPLHADVLISEYIEGSSNNKAIELYNSGDQSVDISQYTLAIYFNGSANSGTTISLSGSIAPGGTYVIANGNANESILAVANITGNVAYNGDDAVVLANDGVVLDVIGRVGEDPGSQWTGNGVGTQNETLERNIEYTMGDPIGDDAFDPSLEWTPKGIDVFSGLGSRIGDGSGEPTDPVDPVDPVEPTPGDGDLIAPCVNCPDLSAIADPSMFDDATFYADVYTAIAALPADPTEAQRQGIKALLSEKAAANHRVLSYNQVWSALTATDEDPANTDNVILIYSGRSIAKFSNGSGEASSNPDNWNREHSWPKSHGFPSQSQDAYSDIHHLRPSDISVNSTRGNLDFDVSDNPIGEAPGSFVDGDSFEPRDEVKGDIARMMMYMDTRYEGDNGDNVGDLVLVNRITNTGENALGKLCTLLDWHRNDPVDTTERNRHDKIYQYQGNRNPYVDNDAWVDIIYPTASCDSVTDPTDPTDPVDPVDPVDPDPVDPVDPVTPSNAPLVLSAIFDGDLSGGLPKGVEIYVTQDIADLSQCGLGSANNGGGSDGQEFSFDAVSASAGDFIYVATEESGFNTYFNFFPDYTSNAMSINGDDAVELYCGGEVIDVYGDINVNGDNEAWDYTDSFANRVPNTSGSASFEPSNWTFAGRSALDGSSTGEAVNLGTFFVEQAEPFISEYVEGGGFNKAIEIVNLSNTNIDLSQYSIQGYQNGSSSVDYTIDLTGTLAARSVFVVVHPDADASAVNVADQLAQFQFNGDDSVILMKGTDVIDAIGQIGVDPGSQWGSGLESTKDNTLRRIVSVTEGDTNPNDEFVPSLEWQGFAKDTLDDLGMYPGLGMTEPSLLIGQCFDDATAISAVQGSQSATPLAGQEVVIEGVVTLVTEGLGGFFLQEEDNQHDNDASTSEAVFVFMDGNDISVMANDIVRVKGVAGEFNDKTQVVANELLPACGVDSVSAQSFSLPLSDNIDLEALENMVVINSTNLVITGIRNYARFGEVVVASERLFTPTHLHLPGSAEAIALAQSNANNQLILDDLVNGSYNPVDNFGEFSPINSPRTGSLVYPSEFVMDYAFGNYRIRPTGSIDYMLETRPSAPQVNGNVKVASFNVLNLFNGDGTGEGFPTSRGADTFTEYQLQLDKIVQAISALDASVVGLMEIENDGYDELSSIAQLVDALNAYNGGDIYSFAQPSAIQGTDQIAVGIIYRNDLVMPVGNIKVLDSSNSIVDDNGPLFDSSRNRPSFAQQFETLDTERTFVVNVNHLKSKSGSSPCGEGDDDLTTGQGNCNLTRTRAAQAIHVWLAEQYPEQAIMIVGDLNAYAQEDPITTLANAGYVDVARAIHGPQAYSYTFDNAFGSLDYVLANQAAMDMVEDVQEWRINADEPAEFDYNETLGFGSTPKPVEFIDTSAFRSSDHDPVVVGLQLDRLQLYGDVNGDGRLSLRDYFSIFLLAGETEGSIRFNPQADMDDNGVINALDRRVWIRYYVEFRRASRRNR